jgi:hypothetical protein
MIYSGLCFGHLKLNWEAKQSKHRGLAFPGKQGKGLFVLFNETVPPSGFPVDSRDKKEKSRGPEDADGKC